MAGVTFTFPRDADIVRNWYRTGTVSGDPRRPRNTGRPDIHFQREDLLAMSDCPCGSSLTYDDCCGPYIAGERPAPTAEALMRSRYTAYATRAVDYLFDTTHPRRRKHSDRESIRQWAEKTSWRGLQIHQVEGGGPDDQDGMVTFTADYTEDGEDRRHEEVARFKRENGLWCFYDGKAPGQAQVVREAPKVGRNAPCPCGSGKKFKKCCGP